MTRPVPFPRAILFDKDGTLFDFRATWGAWAEALLLDLAQGDPVLAEVMATAIEFNAETHSFAADSTVVSGTPDQVADLLLPHLPQPVPRSALISRIDAEAAHAPLAEAVPLAAYLGDLARRELHLGVVTNDAEAPARAHLRTVGVHDHFGFLAGYDSGHGAKPAPGQLLAACRAFGIAPENAVMVGDSQHDLMAGRAAGMRTLGVLTGVADQAALAPLAEAVFPDIGHIPGWLDGLGR